MFNLKASNGEITLTSEMYESKDGAENGVESVRVNAPIDERYEKKISIGGDPYFVLKAADGLTIGTSEMYSSTFARDNGIESVKENAPGAEVEDLT